MSTLNNTDIKTSTAPGRSVVTQEWSLHAELTFSQGHGAAAPTRQPSADSGVHTTYSWENQPFSQHTSGSGTSQFTTHPIPGYGFQRGNILFTTTPPSRSVHHGLSKTQSSTPSNVPESTSSFCSTTARTSQPYNRRCKSTCNIVLSKTCDPDYMKTPLNSGEIPVSRGTSCSPVSKGFVSPHRCNDPSCYHSNCAANVPIKPSSQTLPAYTSRSGSAETCEVCGGGRSPTAIRRAAGSNTFTTHFCTRVPEKAPEKAYSSGSADKPDNLTKESKDVAIQTGLYTGSGADIREQTPCKIADNLLSSGQTTEVVDKKKFSRKLLRSPARVRGKSPLVQSRSNSLSHSAESSPEIGNRKPRTVHIDVYCTGSEDADADASNTSDTAEEGESWSSPQTVYESDKLRVVHTRAGKNQLPQALQQQLSSGTKPNTSGDTENLSSTLEDPSSKDFDSDDGLSSQYPSKQSSYSTIQDTESSLKSELSPSVCPSSTISSSSSLFCTDGYDSAAATSWKDTATEIDSAMQSNVSLAQSDSFEYADAMDRLRIREKERAWAGTDNDPKHSNKQLYPSESKHQLQQQKFKEFLEKHLKSGAFPLWKPSNTEDTDDDDDEDETGDAWSFCGRSSSPKVGTIKREDTIRKASTDNVSLDSEKVKLCNFTSNPLPCTNFQETSNIRGDSGSLSDSGTSLKRRLIRRAFIGPFGYKPPSPPPAKLESVIMTPFAAAMGRGTDQLLKAQKFGTIVGAFRKPGHHVGPARNPDCTCNHCHEYYESIGRRGRARSVGDMPNDKKLEWK